MGADQTWVEWDGHRIEITVGTTVQQLVARENPSLLAGENPAVIASINGRRTGLHESLSGEERLRLIHLRDPMVRSTVLRSALFLLAAAAEDLFPAHRLTVNFSYGGGYYIELDRPAPLTRDELTALENRMGELKGDDLALSPQRLDRKSVV